MTIWKPGDPGVQGDQGEEAVGFSHPEPLVNTEKTMEHLVISSGCTH